MSARNMAKRTAAGTLALAVCLGGGAIALAGAASAAPGFKLDNRIEGADRYATAIAASKAAFPDGTKTDNVILVNGYATVDGLTASYLAGVANAPILYVSDKGADADTKAEIKRLGAKNIWLVGGEKVIPASVADAIKGDGYNVQRINGSDRYETAKLIAAKGAELSGKKPAKVFVASGTSFADALAVSPIAYAKGYAIALTEKDSTSQFTKDELGAIGTDNKILVGGEAVVSKKVQADLSIKDEMRVAGADRAVTANLVSDWAKKSEGFNPANAALVGGTNGNGADSLVASALAAKSLTTLHFAGWDATTVYFKDHAAELTGKGFVFGGKAAVPGDQVDKVQSAAQSVGAAVTFSSDVTSAATIVGDTDASVTTDRNKHDRAYTFSTGSATNVSIALVDPKNVTVGNDGKVAFKSLGTVATRGSVGGVRIVSINGAAVSVTSAQSIAPVDGKVVIKLNGTTTSYGNAIPVVYVPTAGELAVDSAGTPKLGFGIGGATTVVPIESTTLTSDTGWVVDDVNTSTGTIVATKGGASKTFRYSSGDTFKVDSAAVTQKQFFAALNAKDTLTLTYDPAGVDTYVLAVDVPGVPTVGRASLNDTDGDGTPNNVGLTFTNPDNVGITGYSVQVAKLTDGKPGTWAAVTGSPTFNGPTGNATAGAAITATLDVPGSAGDYVYRVRAVGAGAGADADVYSEASNSVTVAATPANVAGIAPSANFDYTDVDNDGALSVNDTIAVTFGSNVVSNGSATITLANADGQTVTLTEGTSKATFAISGGALTVTPKAPVAPSTGSTFAVDTTSAGKAVQVVAVTGITSTSDATNVPNLHRHTDKLFTVEGNAGVIPAVLTSASASASADTITAVTTINNARVRVYDNTGKLLATSPVVSTAGSVTFAAGSDLVKNQKLLITQVNDKGIEGAPTGSAALVPAVAASTTKQGVAISAATAGTAGNAITIAFVAGSGNNVNVGIGHVGSAYTVTLGTDGSGNPDPTKNTVTSVAGVIDADPALVAPSVSGAVVAPESSSPLSGGAAAIPAVPGVTVVS